LKNKIQVVNSATIKNLVSKVIEKVANRILIFSF